MIMNVEKILNQVPMFKKLVLDMILFESKYPVLFTCKNGRDIYLFSCCLVNAKVIKWIGTKTNYETLIKMLQNELTIREAFLKVSEEQIVIEYDGKIVKVNLIKNELVPTELLPTAGEYMDAEEGEYAEEIAEFEYRNKNLEFTIKIRPINYSQIRYRRKNVAVSDAVFNMDFVFANEKTSDFTEISNYCMA